MRSTVGPYELVREIARGAGGVVYLAQRPDLHSQCALKFLAVSSPNAASFERFRREVAMASRLEHPGVVAVFDVGEHEGRPYYAMQYCVGPTLRERLRRGSLLGAEAANLVAALAEAVAYAHEKGVIHRDLRPANIILDGAQGRPRITDFGIAKDTNNAGGALTTTGEVLGAPHASAPEQLQGRRDLDGRVDVYSLGAILYECLTGRLPFDGIPLSELFERKVTNKETPQPPSSLDPLISPELDAICARALAPSRANRYSTADALLSDLKAFLQGQEAPTDQTKESYPNASRQNPAPWLVGAAGVITVAVLLFAVLLFSGDPPAPSQARTPAQTPPAPPPPVDVPSSPAVDSLAPSNSEEPTPVPAVRRERPKHTPPGSQERVAEREAMVEEISFTPDPIRDHHLLNALRTVPRHIFAPFELGAYAYTRQSLPFYERRAISEPSLMGRMIERLQIGLNDRVLELGTSSGWQTALLAHMTPDVYSVEPSERIHQRASRLLQEQGYSDVKLRCGEPQEGWAEKGPFDAVLFTGSAPHVSEALWNQLARGGRIVICRGPAQRPQRLMLITKLADGRRLEEDMGGAGFHTLPRFSEPQAPWPLEQR